MESVRSSRKGRIGIALVLLAFLLVALIYIGRSGKVFPRSDPRVGKETGVVIEGTVTCNGQVLTVGYVVAWQGPPIAYAEVKPDGSYQINNGPLGKCILTYSTTPPASGTSDATNKKSGLDDPTGLGLGGPKTPPSKDGKDFPPKDGDPPPKEGDGPPTEGKDGKDPPPKDKGPPPDKDGGTKKDMPPGSGELKGPPKNNPSPPGEKDGPKDAPFAKKDGKPPLGKSGPPKKQEISSEQQKLTRGAGEKYSDPSKNAFELETRKGMNPFNLPLVTP